MWLDAYATFNKNLAIDTELIMEDVEFRNNVAKAE
jgi:hypothetical protein